MLKSFNELRKIDVRTFCKIKKGKDENGKVIDLAYLPWAKCMDLLHEHGAESVTYRGVKNEENGTYLFEHYRTQDKNGRQCGCYFVSVEVKIDDKTYTLDYPLMNGNLVVYDDTLNQLRISNAHARAFVKCVAINTGLGFELWAGGNDDDDDTSDDLSIHNIWAIKTRIEQRITELIKRGMSEDEILTAIKITKKQYETVIRAYNNIAYIEGELKKL